MNAQPDKLTSPLAQESLADSHARIRQRSMDLCATLTPEDTVAQSMPDASPVKWHLAHTTWFFEKFVLSRNPAWRPRHPEWHYLFNSYYQSAGPMHARAQRGLLSRPTLAEVMDFRRQVDAGVHEWLARHPDDDELAMLVTLGLNHEQQHQELLLTDVKHLFSINPLEPVYADTPHRPGTVDVPLRFIEGQAGVVEIGHAGTGFAYDNEKPRHRELLHPHAIANRLVNNAEFRQFIEDGGYRTPTLWMAEGWAAVQHEGWAHPLYWSDDLESEFTLGGRRAIDPRAPVCHVSYYEADAFARWAGARLPREVEWEHLAASGDVEAGHFQESGCLHPQAPRADADAPLQLFGDVWEWTSSPYVAYPGFKPLDGTLGEYNGKFMCGQWVLRGGSCVTSAGHVRASYRNFFYPPDRWQFMGIRLGKDA
ncbi:MAG TPA: ergothioneine biosynthesis protein EgtB [Rhodanobacteraceae bacterium]|nr:ergothioneine biosynthesis protein EgtB [Rhodanobacteraceae bacterium]